MTRHTAALNLQDTPTTGRALRRFREDSGESSKDFAARAGIAPSYLSEVETGKRRMTPQFIGKMALALGKEPDEFTEILDKIHLNFTADAESNDLTSLREELPHRNLRPNNPAPGDEHRELSAWLVTKMPKHEAWRLLRELTESAEQGDQMAARCAKALLNLLAESP